MSAGAQGLARDRLSLRHLMFQGLAYMSLAPVIYFNAGYIESLAGGPVMPLVFIAVTVAIIPTAISFAIMNGQVPAAGSASVWVRDAVAPWAGRWTGWLLASTYLVACGIYVAYFAIFFNPLLEYFGIGASYWTGAIAAIAMVAGMAVLIKRDIQFSMRKIGLFMAIEASFLVLFSIYVIAKQGIDGQLSLQPFNPSAASAGSAGFVLALVIGVLSIAGVDSVAVVAEETRTPRRLLPRATVAVTLTAGAFWAFVSYALAVSASPATIIGYVNEGLVTPVYPIADSYIGALKILVPLTAMSGVFAGFGATLVCASRMLYSLAQQGYGPQRWAQLHPLYRSPWNAAKLPLALGVALATGVGIWLGRNASAAAGWTGGAFVFFILVVYALVNLSNLLYHLRTPGVAFNWLTNGVVPVTGIVVDLYILYRGFFKAYLEAPFKTGGSIVLFCSVWAVVGLVWSAMPHRRAGRVQRIPAQSADAVAVEPAPATALSANSIDAQR